METIKSVLVACSIIVFCVVSLFPLSLSAEALSLIHDGQSDYSIAVSSEASPSEKFAARELQRYIRASAGVLLPLIQSDLAKENMPLLLVGFSETATRLGISESLEDVGDQGFLFRSVPPHFFIGGSREAGTLYGVNAFLEEFLGVRWYAPGEETIPEISTLSLPEMDKIQKPAFKWRHTSYAWPGKDDLFLARLCDNDGMGTGEREQGIQYTQDGRCHTYFRFISPSEYFDSHPEYFSEIGGIRRKHETQLCLSNPEVLEIVTEKMLERMRAQPEITQHNFSQMDYYNYCECPQCTAINERYGTSGGTQYWFLNQLAERTSVFFPEKTIGTLAYMYTEEPPEGLALHPNIAIWLCHMFPSCDSHSIATCPHNRQYRERAKRWAELTKHLYIWHYVVNFVHYYSPFPNFGALAEDMRFYKNIGVEGIYLQGMGHSGGGGEFSLLRPWYGMKLLWNPDYDAQELLQDFLQGYYGKAWNPVYRYINMLQDEVDKNNIHMHLYTNPAQGYLPDEIIDAGNRLFDEAESLAMSDDNLLEKIRVARMPLHYACFFPRNGYRIEEEQLIFNEPLADFDTISSFVSRLEKHGFKTIREVQGDPQQLFLLGLAFSSPLHAPKISSKYLEADFAPFLGGRALRVTDKNTGLCVTGYNITRNLFFPFCGGEELRLGGEFDPAGMFYQFEIVSRKDNALTLQAEADGWLITREFTLHPDNPVLTIKATVKNLLASPREAMMRSHTNFHLGALQQFNVHFTDLENNPHTHQADEVIPGLREGIKFRKKEIPLNEWCLRGDIPLEVIQRFDSEQLDHAWLYAYPEYINDLECELWAKAVLLQPGESHSFTVDWEIHPVSLP